MRKTASIPAFAKITALLFLALLITTSTHATAPIEGNTVEFADSGQALGFYISYKVAMGDVDNDGDLDAFVANSGGQANRVWLNQGGVQAGTPGVFNDSLQTLGTGWSVYVSLGDLDGDGDLDAFVANLAGSDKVWINQGGAQAGTLGIFSDSMQPLGMGNSGSIVLGDLDGDGDLDAFVGNNSNQANTVWINQGGAQMGTEGAFSDSGQTLGSAGSVSVALGDLDGDGDLDAFVGNNESGGTRPNKVWLNQGGAQAGTPGIFSDSMQNLGNSISTNVDLADLDGDGDLDAFVGNSDGANVVWVNQGGAQAGTQGVFSDSGQTLGSSQSFGVKLGDLDNDGDVDAFVANNGTANKIWVNDGSGIFADSGLDLGSSNSYGVDLGDVDNDGDVDAFAVNFASQANIIWRNDAVHRNAPFANSGNTIGGGWTLDVALGDVDGDGDLDAFVAQYTHAGTANHVFENDGSGVFSLTNSLGSGRSRGVDLGDVDGDGDLDAFVANWGVNKVWKNNGDGIFSDSGNNLGTANTEAVALGDVDGDGDLDAFAANHSGASVVWKNDGNGNFTAFATLGSSDSYNVALGDLDRDGDLDAFVANRSQPNVVWQNDGSGNFTAIANLGSAESFGVALGDINGDGDLDAFVANSVDNALWINNGSGGFTASSQTFSGTSGNEVALIDLDGDGDLDTFFSSSKSDKVWLNDGAGNFSNSGQNLVTWASTGIAIGDLDGDGDPDAAFSAKNASNQIWRNEGGSAGFALADTSVSSPTFIANSTEDDVMKVVFTHNGLAGDRSLELARFDLDFFRGDCSTPLSNAEADAFLDEIHIRLDDGNNSFDTSDTLVASISSFSMTSGVQSIAFTNDDANAQVAGTTSKTYWISALATATASTANPNNFCLNFDPDADALVEGKTPDFSVSIQDSDPTATSNTPTAVSLQALSAATNNNFVMVALAMMLIGLVTAVFLIRRRQTA